MSNVDQDGRAVNPISQAEFDRRVQDLVDIGFTEEEARAGHPPVIADAPTVDEALRAAEDKVIPPDKPETFKRTLLITDPARMPWMARPAP